MKDYHTIQIGIDYPSQEIDDLDVSSFSQRYIKLKNSNRIGENEFHKICKDHEQLGKLLVDHPDTMREILNDVLSGRHESARKKAKSIGFTEEEFQRKGCGVFWWLVAGVVVAILLYPSEAQ